MRTLAALALLVGSLGAFVLGAPVARAQDDAGEPDAAFQTAAARVLFQEGVALARDGSYRDAADRFRRAQSLHPAPTVAFNLASALIHQGHLVEASEILESVARDPASPAELALAARRQRDELGPRIARLTLRLDGPAAGVRVVIDAHPISDAAIGVAVPIDPGSHVVRALRDDGQVAAHDRIELVEGESRELSLVVPIGPLLPETILDTPPAPPPAAPPNDDGVWIGLGVGLGVAILAGGVTTAVVLSLPGPSTPVTGNTLPPVLEW